ncbi:MAG: 30S ribosomal protein S20 [Gemmatimonadota bacterium]
MPNIKSAKRRMRTSLKAQERNRAAKSRLRTAIKRVLQAGSSDDATARLREAAALIDRAATRRLIHPNRASRFKARLARHVARLAA